LRDHSLSTGAVQEARNLTSLLVSPDTKSSRLFSQKVYHTEKNCQHDKVQGGVRLHGDAFVLHIPFSPSLMPSTLDSMRIPSTIFPQQE